MAYIRDAQIHLAKAFGLKDLVATLEAEKFAIENPSTISPPDGKKQLESSLAANEAIGERMEQQQVLSAEGKKEYEASLDPYSAGMHETVLLAPQVLDLSAGLGKSLTGGVAGLAGGISKGSAAGFLIKEFRPFYKEMRKTFRQIASFAKVQAIPIPADATAALGSLPEDEVGDNLAILMLERLELVVDGTFGADTLIAAAAAPTPVVASVAGSQVASEGAAVPAAEIAAEPVRVVAMSAAAAPPPTSPPPSASPALAPSTPRAPMPTAVIARAADPLPTALEPPPPRITSRQPLSRELDGP